MIAQINKEYFKTRPTKLWTRLISYGLFEGRPATTKGQWLNPFVFKLFELWKTFPQLTTVNSPVFIIGAGRSGTTLLGIILSIHRDISFLNEPKALWHEIYGEEDIIGSYSNGKAYYSLDECNVNESAISNAQKLYGAYLTITGGSRVVDKYPELIFRVPFVKQLFPDAKFLFITRNGYDTLKSIELWSQRLGKQENGNVHDWWGVNNRKWRLMCEQLIPESNYLQSYKTDISKFQSHKDRATVEWILTMEKGIHIQYKFSESIFTFKYEELLNNHTNVIKKILHFTDLSMDKKLVEYANRAIRKPTLKKKVAIHPILIKPFLNLMEQYNYNTI